MERFINTYKDKWISNVIPVHTHWKKLTHDDKYVDLFQQKLDDTETQPEFLFPRYRGGTEFKIKNENEMFRYWKPRFYYRSAIEIDFSSIRSENNYDRRVEAVKRFFLDNFEIDDDDIQKIVFKQRSI